MPDTQNYPELYTYHNKVCNLFAQQSPDTLYKVLVFVFLTIRESTPKLDSITQAYRKHSENIPSFNMQMRRIGTTYAKENKVYLYTEFMHILNSSLTDQEKEFWLIDLFAEIPYLNTAKAGFATTLSTPFGGCFDRWHLERFNVSKDYISINKNSKSMEHRADKIRIYQSEIKRSGGTAFLWDVWMDECAERFPKYYKSGAEVSARHIWWLSGEKVFDF